MLSGLNLIFRTKVNVILGINVLDEDVKNTFIENNTAVIA